MKTLAQARADYEVWLKDPKARALSTVRWGTPFMRRAAGDPALGGCSEVGNLILVGGWPASGKSMWGLQQLAYLPAPSLYLSFEDSEREVAKRGAIIDPEQQAMITLVTDPALANIPAIEETVREYRMGLEEDGPFVVLVDYVQLLSLGQGTFGQTARTLELAQIMGHLRKLGREEGAVFILNAHLQRPAKPVKKRNGDEEKELPRPRMSDLGDSKSLEGGADAVILLYPRNEDGLLEVYNAKHKHGPQGARTLYRRDIDSGWLDELT